MDFSHPYRIATWGVFAVICVARHPTRIPPPIFCILKDTTMFMLADFIFVHHGRNIRAILHKLLLQTIGYGTQNDIGRSQSILKRAASNGVAAGTGQTSTLRVVVDSIVRQIAKRTNAVTSANEQLDARIMVTTKRQIEARTSVAADGCGSVADELMPDHAPIIPGLAKVTNIEPPAVPFAADDLPERAREECLSSKRDYTISCTSIKTHSDIGSELKGQGARCIEGTKEETCKYASEPEIASIEATQCYEDVSESDADTAILEATALIDSSELESSMSATLDETSEDGPSEHSSDDPSAKLPMITVEIEHHDYNDWIDSAIQYLDLAGLPSRSSKSVAFTEIQRVPHVYDSLDLDENTTEGSHPSAEEAEELLQCIIARSKTRSTQVMEIQPSHETMTEDHTILAHDTDSQTLLALIRAMPLQEADQDTEPQIQSPLPVSQDTVKDQIASSPAPCDTLTDSQRLLCVIQGLGSGAGNTGCSASANSAASLAKPTRNITMGSAVLEMPDVRPGCLGLPIDEDSGEMVVGD